MGHCCRCDVGVKLHIDRNLISATINCKRKTTPSQVVQVVLLHCRRADREIDINKEKDKIIFNFATIVFLSFFSLLVDRFKPTVQKRTGVYRKMTTLKY